MISVEQALQILQSQCKATLKSEIQRVSDALGFVLFEDVKSPINMPPFRQSAMDGYAISIHDSLEYFVVGEVKAGDGNKPKLNPGEAIRIFTGAPVPDLANAIAIQEKVEAYGNQLKLTVTVNENDNIRPLGEQVKKGHLALKKGTKLTSAAIAYLTSLGITEVKVYKKPCVAMVVTGNELAEAGQPLLYGQIYESNAIMLKSALAKAGFNEVTIHKIADDYELTYNNLNDIISQYDVIIVSGGISVGDYDFVGKALQQLGVQELFYKVKQKPGKPLFFGKKEEKLIFALPGNPAAALSCYYIYVLTALEKFSGNTDFSLHRIQAASITNFFKKGDRSQFLKAIYKNGKVEILEGQNSSMLHTFALANALVYLDANRNTIEIDDHVETILLPIH
jgi:molybdopterin molybdotransferase